MAASTAETFYLAEWFTGVLGADAAAAPAPNAWAAPCAPCRSATHRPSTPTHMPPWPARCPPHGSVESMAAAPSTPGSDGTTSLSLLLEQNSRDEALAILSSRHPEADLEMLSFLLDESSGDIAVAEDAYRRSCTAERGATTSTNTASLAPTRDMEAAADEPPAPTLPLPIPLGSLRVSSCHNLAESPSWDGWAQGSLPAEDSAMGGNSSSASPQTGAPVRFGDAHPHDIHPDNNAYGHLADQLAGAKLSNGQSHSHSSDDDRSMPGWGVWEPVSSGGIASRPAGDACTGWRARSPPRRDDASRQAASEAFVAAQQAIQALKDEAGACRTQAINARRMDRPHEAAQLEKRAKQLEAQARALKERSAREAFQRNNQGSVCNMPPLDLHNLTVGDAMRMVADTIGKAHGLVGLYSAVTVPFVTGRGAHSHDGVPKIRCAVEEWLDLNGIQYRHENAGGQVVALLGTAC